MNINQAILRAKSLMLKYPELRYWSVTSNNRKRSFGLCSYTKLEIQLSKILVPLMSDKAIDETIIHEIAHALTRGHGHDSVWKSKCIELGGNGKRCGGDEKYEEVKEAKIVLQKLSKYTLTCPVCGSVHNRNRYPKRKISCANHGPKYNEKYQFIITQNY